jgi:hypothetical protein
MFLCWVFFFFWGRGRLFELRAYILSHSTSPFLVMAFFELVLSNCLPRLALNHDPLVLCLLRVARIIDVSYQHLACVRYFWDRISQNVFPGWLRATVLLISASWVARITGMSPQHLTVVGINRWFQCVAKTENHLT